MAITKRNLYSPGQFLNNLCVNVDDNRLGIDQTEISVNFGTTPATVTISVGSIIEVNGNNYVIDTADYSFQMANATDRYITFTDNPSTAFSSAATKGSFNAQKQGYYQTGNVIRSLNWFIDQANEIVMREDVRPIDEELRYYFEVQPTSNLTFTGTGTSEIASWGAVNYNYGGCYSDSTGRFTAPESGLFIFNYVFVDVNLPSDTAARVIFAKNGTAALFTALSAELQYTTYNLIVPMKQGDYVSLFFYRTLSGTSTIYASETSGSFTTTATFRGHIIR